VSLPRKRQYGVPESVVLSRCDCKIPACARMTTWWGWIICRYSCIPNRHSCASSGPASRNLPSAAF